MQIESGNKGELGEKRSGKQRLGTGDKLTCIRCMGK